MRMWMVDPKYMCTQHLKGEHVELHMFLGTFKRGCRIDNYIHKNLLEYNSMVKRHEEIVNELVKRGKFNHQSNLCQNEIISSSEHICQEYKEYKIDKQQAFIELLSRCPSCRKEYLKYHEKLPDDVVVRSENKIIRNFEL